MSEEMVTDQSVKSDRPLTGSRRSKKTSLMGIDPLAWLKEDELFEQSSNEKLSAGEEQIKKSGSKYTVENAIAEAVDHNVDNSSEQSEEITDPVSENDEVNEMETDQAETNTEGSIKLEGPISIADVSELHKQLKALLVPGQTLEIDCSEVEAVDAAALQLLVAFTHETDKQGMSLVWKNPSDSLQAAAQLLGLKNELRM